MVDFFNGDAHQVFQTVKTDITTHSESQGGEHSQVAERNSTFPGRRTRWL
jgi:hypothetical protein